MNLLTRRRRCPQCAELIQPEAIKCRYCLSDLTVDAPPSKPDETALLEVTTAPVEMNAAPAEAAEPKDDAESAGLLRRTWFSAALVAGLLLIVLAGWAARDAAADADRLEDRRAARDEVRSVISEQVETLLSYDYRTFGEQDAKVAAVLAPSFREEYSATFDDVREKALAERISQVAYVVGVSTVSYDVDRVKALLFVNTLSSRQGTERKKLLQNRLLVTMVRDADDWLIGDVTIPVT